MSNRRSESRLVAILAVAAALAAGPGPRPAHADGPDPIDPNPKLVGMPQALAPNDTFGFTARVEHPGSATLTGLLLTLSVETNAGARLVVPSDSRFSVTDTDGAPLSANSLVTAMVLHPSSAYSQLASNGVLEVTIGGAAGASTGQAIVHLGVSCQEAASTSTASSAIPIE